MSIPMHPGVSSPARCTSQAHRRRRLGMVFLFLAAAGCGESHSAVTDPAAPPPPTAVSVVTPQLRTIKRGVSQPGTIQAFEQTPIFAKVPGYVQKWCVDIGDEIHKDEVLAELWVPELVSELNLKKEQVEQAKKALSLARTQVETAKALVKEAEAALGQATALNRYWKGQSESFAKLVAQNVLEKQSQADARSQYEAATAALVEAQAKISSATALQQEKEVAHDKAAIDIRAAVADQQRQADLVRYATFLAPYDGVVTRRNINTFDFVQPPTAGKGDPLYVVERRDRMRIFVEVPESAAVWVTKETQGRVRVPALQGREFVGQVARTSYALDRTTRTLLVEFDFDNPKDELRPGMYAYARIEAEGREVLTLPASAVVTEGDVNVGYQRFCYLVEEGRVKRTQIEIGVRNDQLVEVLQKRVPGVSTEEGPRWEPFTGAEKVVQGDLSGLKDGQPVEAKPAEK
jgi:HlyD family secretion protein